MIFHQSPFTQERTEVQKGIFSLDTAFTWFCISFKAGDTFSNRSGMYTQHSTLVTAQVPPWAAVSMSNVILFWITAFFIWICSSFKACMAFVLSKRACLVKLVKGSTLTMMSVVPTEDTNKAARESYHWSTDGVHLAGTMSYGALWIFGGNNIPLIWVCYSSPLIKWPQNISVFNGAQNKRCLCPGHCDSCPASETTWTGRANGLLLTFQVGGSLGP